MLLGFQCPICNQTGPRFCRRCLERLPPAGRIRPLPGVSSAKAVWAYDYGVQRLVLAAKNGNRRDLLKWAATELVGQGIDLGSGHSASGGQQVDVVTWMPASSDGRRRRGFDQGQELARVVASSLEVPCRRLVGRRRGESQIGRSRQQRLVGPTLFGVRAAPRRVLVVDDVVTTGGSVAALAKVVRRQGASEVHFLAVAAVD